MTALRPPQSRNARPPQPRNASTPLVAALDRLVEDLRCLAAGSSSPSRPLGPQNDGPGWWWRAAVCPGASGLRGANAQADNPRVTQWAPSSRMSWQKGSDMRTTLPHADRTRPSRLSSPPATPQMSLDSQPGPVDISEVRGPGWLSKRIVPSVTAQTWVRGSARFCALTQGRSLCIN